MREGTHTAHSASITIAKAADLWIATCANEARSPSHFVPTGTSRGFGVTEVRRVGSLILNVVGALAAAGAEGDAAAESAVLDDVRGLCGRFPIYR